MVFGARQHNSQPRCFEGGELCGGFAKVVLRGGLCAKDALAPLYVVEVDFKDAAFAQQVLKVLGEQEFLPFA